MCWRCRIVFFEKKRMRQDRRKHGSEHLGSFFGVKRSTCARIRGGKRLDTCRICCLARNMPAAEPCIQNTMYYVVVRQPLPNSGLQPSFYKFPYIKNPMYKKSHTIKHPIDPIRWTVYSASCSGNAEGYFWRCLRLFRGGFGKVVGGNIKENYPESNRKT